VKIGKERIRSLFNSETNKDKERCLWKRVSEDKDSTTTIDMVKSKARCFKCGGFDTNCPHYFPDEKRREN